MFFLTFFGFNPQKVLIFNLRNGNNLATEKKLYFLSSLNPKVFLISGLEMF